LRLLEKGSGKRFSIYSGNDDSALALMAMGSDGVISVTANVAPKLMADMCRLALAGDFAGARAVNDTLMPLHFDLFVEANPIPAKWVLARMGRCNAKTRLPMTPLSARFEPVLEAAMRHAALL
jgi:4-hydroxy-tetrahydrodipicolinate synthase